MSIYDLFSAQLEARLTEEKRIEIIRRKERNENHLYMTMNVLLEDCFDGHQGHDLFDQEQVALRAFRVKKSSTVEEIAVTLSDTFVSFWIMKNQFYYCLEKYPF